MIGMFANSLRPIRCLIVMLSFPVALMSCLRAQKEGGRHRSRGFRPRAKHERVHAVEEKYDRGVAFDHATPRTRVPPSRS